MANSFHTVSTLIADALDLSGTEISNILDSTPFLARLPFVESSNGIVHKYITHTANPTVGFVAENGGRDFSKSVDTPVTANLKILDFSFAVSKATADAWRAGGAAAMIAREAQRHLTSAMVALEAQILNNADASNGFTGFSANAGLNNADDAMVVNAGGTTADTAASVYLVREGDGIGVAGVYKGDGPSVTLGDTIIQNFLDGNGKNYPAYYTPGTSWFGLQFGGTYSTSRIANLTEDAGKGLTDELIYEAWSRHPVGQKPTVIVMNRRSQEQLRSSRTATNAVGSPAPLPGDWEGLPIVVTDTLSSTEAIIADA